MSPRTPVAALTHVRAVCVFCGSSEGASPKYIEAARDLGRTLARAGVRLVYGGASVGLMGALADAALPAGGEVVGVIPWALRDREIAHDDLTELLVVDSMHERKSKMAELSDAFVALPGGIGTLEELFEVWSWAQLGIHRKRVALLDVDGYYAPLLTFLDLCVDEGFVREVQRELLIVVQDSQSLLSALSYDPPPAMPRWLDETQL